VVGCTTAAGSANAAEVALDRIPELPGEIEGLPDDAQPDDGSLDP